MVRRRLAEMRDGWRQLRSRAFWVAFCDYWAPSELAKRMNAWADRTRNHG